ncbi:MAG: O-antigen ligase family protein [Bryobacteraceae bacterium]
MQFVGLLLVLCFGVLTIWTPNRWAVSGLETGVFAITIVAAWRSGFRAVPWPLDWLQILFAITVIWGLAQLIAHDSVYRFETWSAVLGWLALFFAYSTGLQVFANATLRRRFRVFAIVFGALIALWAILQLFSAEGKILWFYSTPESDRPMGPFLSADHFSAFMELLLPIALWEALIDRRRALLYGCAAALMYASVIAGTSRAGSVIVNLELGAVLIPGLTRDRNRRGIGGMALQIGSLILMFSAVVGWNELLKRFQAKDPFTGRREAWEAGIAMIHQRPWFGFGLGTWTAVYPSYAVFDPGVLMNAAHSDWLQWIGDGGIPFGILMSMVAIRALWLGIKAPWGLGVVFVFIHSLVDFPLQIPPIFVWLTIVLAALAAGARRTASDP